MTSIQNNLMGLNAHQNSAINNMKLQTSLMRLSSGYRINSAADDAAGLAISEKMRGEQTALERAMMNAQDGASLVQTADGALSTTHSILNRLTDLAMQASNGTLNDSQRANLNNEAKSLMEEIDRVSKSTDFNGINLLDGSLASGEELSIHGAASSLVADNILVDKNSINLFDGTNIEAAKFSIDGKSFAVANESNYDTLAAQLAGSDVSLIKVSGTSGANLTPTDLEEISSTVNGQTGTDFRAVVGGIAMETGSPLELQVGTTGEAHNTVAVSVGDMSSKGLGIDAISLNSQSGAQAALEKIRNAIGKVSDSRGSLGATQNRLEHTINNLGSTYENVTKAESNIRDADMAKEMMNYTKRNLLSQVSNSMMAQANMSQQMLLQLLR